MLGKIKRITKYEIKLKLSSDEFHVLRSIAKNLKEEEILRVTGYDITTKDSPSYQRILDAYKNLKKIDELEIKN